jgi:P22_AR N-terminal domain
VCYEQEQDSSPLVPIEQQTIIFYEKPLVVVRLPDGRPGVVLRHFCDNLQLEPTSQVRRIKRTEAIADDLMYIQIQTEGGPQIMPTLVLRAVPCWLAGIDPKRVREEIRPEILRYQREVVDVLYAWAQSPKVADPPTALVPAEQIVKPAPPADDAGLEVWREYHRQMVAWIDWQHDIETWRGSAESRLEGLEEVTNLIPEILERLGPPTQMRANGSPRLLSLILTHILHTEVKSKMRALKQGLQREPAFPDGSPAGRTIMAA